MPTRETRLFRRIARQDEEGVCKAKLRRIGGGEVQLDLAAIRRALVSVCLCWIEVRLFVARVEGRPQKRLVGYHRRWKGTEKKLGSRRCRFLSGDFSLLRLGPRGGGLYVALL